MVSGVQISQRYRLVPPPQTPLWMLLTTSNGEKPTSLLQEDRKHLLMNQALAGLMLCRRFLQTMKNSDQHRVRSIKPAMVLSWAKAPGPLFWKNLNMQRPGEPKFMPKSPAQHPQLMLITS